MARKKAIGQFVVSIVDNPKGLPKPVLQLLNQEKIVVKYVAIPLNLDFSLEKVPLAYWENQVGKKLKQKRMLIDPPEPNIVHARTFEDLDIRPVQAFLVTVLQNYIVEQDKGKVHKNGGNNKIALDLIVDIPIALLSPRESIKALFSINDAHSDKQLTGNWLAKMIVDFIEIYPMYFEN